MNKEKTGKLKEKQCRKLKMEFKQKIHQGVIYTCKLAQSQYPSRKCKFTPL